MATPAQRLIGLLLFVGFIVLFVTFFTVFLAVAAAILVIAALGGLLFYLRMRFAVKRFRRRLEQAKAEAARQAGQSGQSGQRQEVIDAEFRVKDE